MTTLIEAAQQALEAMLIKQQVTMWAQDGDRAKFNQAITVLRQAIEQAQLVQRAENAFERYEAKSDKCLMENAQGDLERVTLVQTGVGIGKAEQAQPVTYDKTELNCFAQDLYDQKMREGKHGHYEAMFHVIHQCIKRVAPTPRKPLTIAEEAAAFGEWFDAVWAGDAANGQVIPTQGHANYDLYMNERTVAFGAWMAAKKAAHGITGEQK